jgi:CheY-like chemotaxis protein
MLTKDTLIDLLRDNLSHLYDTGYLRQSRLGAMLGVANRSDVASALRERLVRAVEALKPADEVPSQSRDWRLYDALFYAYVQQLDQRIVADQLGLSVRHLRREQRAALKILADRLWAEIESEPEPDRDQEAATEPAGGGRLSEEMTWLTDLPAETPTELAKTLEGAIALISPLAEQNQVTIERQRVETVPRLAVHPVALNQMLLNLLSIAVSQLENETVEVSARAREWCVDLRIQGGSRHLDVDALPADDLTSFQVTDELAEMSGGCVQWLDGHQGFGIRLTLPALNQLSVLAIDDNVDTLQLMERYTAGTQYRLVGCRDPERILLLVEMHTPQIIILDVMMPQIDGWKILGMLREHPTTEGLPVVICTVLTQERLARSLGAADYLRKPFTRHDLLTVLKGQV